MLTKEPLRVLIVQSPSWVASCLHTQLTNLGHKVVAEATNGREAILLTQQLCPDLVIMDVEIPRMDELQAIEDIGQRGLCPTLLLGAHGEFKWAQKARSLPVHAYLAKPVDKRNLESAITLALKHFHQVQHLPNKKEQPETILDTRSAINRATDRLISRYNLSTRKAQAWIQHEARAKKASLDEVAEAILNNRTVDYHYSVPVSI